MNATTRKSVIERCNVYGMEAGAFFSPYDLKNKERAIRDYCMYFLDRISGIFKWEGLPDSLPAEFLELQALTCGFTFTTNKNKEKEIRTYWGGLGDGMTAYYFPKKIIVANPWDNTMKTFDLEKDGVLLKNDSRMVGIMPLINKYATLLVENELSLKILMVNSRMVNLITAPDDDVYTSAKRFLEKIEEGDNGVIMNEVLDESLGLKTHSIGNVNSNAMTQLLETEQYLKASLWQELGLESNHNMKRESLNEAETSMNNKTTLPLIDNMLKCRKEYAEKLNKMYGLNVTVELSGAWALQHSEALMHAKEDGLEDEVLEADKIEEEVNKEELGIEKEDEKEKRKEGGDE